MFLLFTLPCLAAGWSDAPWMGAAPTDLIAAAASAPRREGEDVHVLDTQLELAVDAEGRTERRFRRVFVLRTARGVDEWGAIHVGWAEWHEERPEVAARVITPDGVAHTLDPAAISEATDPNARALTYSDEKVLRAPLPALSPGVIVEETIVQREHTPFAAEGAGISVYLAPSEPTDRFRATVTVDDRLPLTWRMEGTELRPTESRRKGARVLTLEVSPLEPVPPMEDGTPLEVLPPVLYASTAKSWSVLAAKYAEIVDSRLAGADLGAKAAAARGTATERRAIIAALLAEVRKTRYVGIEFGRSAIVPATPAEVLARGYGDCKDKATLLVGMLRASGIPADVALLRTRDVGLPSPLPGLEDFNHAIVHVGGPDELWIDPTSDWTPVGDLPWTDQGVPALIASRSSRGLATVPLLASTASHLQVNVDVTLAERGDAVVKEVATSTGWIAVGQRVEHTGDPKDIQSRAEAIATERYVDAKVHSNTWSEPRDLTVPFTTTLVVDDAGYGQTADEWASARFVTWPAMAMLPDILMTEPQENEKPRRNPFFVFPYSADYVQVVHPPAGFVPGVLPEPEDGGAGPVRWSTRYSAEADGSIKATFHLDTGEGRMDIATLASLRQAVLDRGHSDIPQLLFDHAGARAIRAGHTGEGLAAYSALAASTPPSAVALARLGLALVGVGFGDAGAARVAEAVKLAPDNADLATDLAWTRLHTPDGRWLEEGFDAAGAREAVERALVIDPKDAYAWQLAAALAERGTDGTLYGPGARVDDAITALQKRRTVGENKDLDTTLASYLVRQGRWADLESLVTELPAGVEKRAFQVVLGVTKGGVDPVAAAAKAGGTTEERRAALEAAGPLLIQTRRYDAAAKALEAAAVGAADPLSLRTRARTVAAMVPYDATKVDKADPAAFATRIFASVYLGEQPLANLLSHAFGDLDSPEAQQLGSTEVADTMQKARTTTDLPPEVLLDTVLATTKSVVTGAAPTGWRVEVSGPNQVFGHFFVVREKGECRMRAADSNPEELGSEALARVRRKDYAGARQWLEWARELRAQATPADSFVGAPFSRTWRGQDGEDPALLRTAAAMLMAAAATRAPEAIEVLQVERGATTDPERQLQIDRSLMIAYIELSRWSEAEAVARRLVEGHPTAAEPLTMWGIAAAALHHPEAARAASVAAMRAQPDEIAHVRLSATLAGEARDTAEELALWQRAITMPKATASDYNELAWASLTDPAYRARAVDWSIRGNQISGFANAAQLNTLAIVLIEAGRPDEAREVIVKAEPLLTTKDTRSAEAWTYARGRLAEVWGLPDVAASLYAKIGAPSPTATLTDVRVMAAARKAAAAR